MIIGALIIKELFDLSDDEMVENLMLDPRYQYALHTTSFTEQPLSDKTLSRFRKRCYDYESTFNVDLYHDCITDLGSKIAKMMKLNSRIRRMDSMMIESNIHSDSQFMKEYLSSQETQEEKVTDIYADFEFNEQGTRITRCPAGHTPKSSSYMSQTKQCRASFDRTLCASCPQ